MSTHSKMLVFELTPLPTSTAANCKENIDNWLERNKTGSIEKFLRPDKKGHKGYRFITASDLEDSTTIELEINSVKVVATYNRKVRSSGSMDPLWFVEARQSSYIDVELTYHNRTIEFVFRSDNDLKKQIRSFKKSLKS